jgi:hypothetical protein
MVLPLYEDPQAFSSFSRKKDVKLMGMNDFASSYELHPDFGMNIILV